MPFKLVEDANRTVVQIDVYEVIHDVLKASDRKDLIESLACAEDVIEHVMAQVLEGCTESGFMGSCCSSMNTAIQKARVKIAKESDYVVKKTIEDFERKVEGLEKDVEYYRRHYEPIRAWE